MMFRSSLLVLAFSTLVIFAAAAPAVDDVVSEETLVQSIDESFPKINLSEFLARTQDAKSAAEVVSLLAQKAKPESVKALNDAVDNIIGDVIKAHKASQKLINEEIDTYATCAAMPLVDKDANENAANKFKLIEPAQKEQDKAKTGKIDYDFGKDATESAIAASGVKSAVDAYKKVFDDAFNRRATAKSNHDAAQKASDNADEARKKANHQCYCAARKTYDDVVKAAKDSNNNDKKNLKHFQMVQCVMAEFAKGNKEAGALKACVDKKYEDKAVTLDFRADDAKLDQSIKCEAPKPTKPTKPSFKKIFDAGGCAHQGANLGTKFKTPQECSAAASKNSKCGGTVMWAPTYNYAWGCRCCSPGGAGTDAQKNQNWERWSKN